MKRQLPEKVKAVMQKVLDNKGEIFVVGGAVRDWLLKREIKDWDFATNLKPEEMKEIFPKNSFCENKFGTFSIILKDGEIFEVTTYRTERGYSDKRHPDEVKWGKSLREDVERRDFTINAMAMDIGGEIIDYHNGLEDLNNHLIQ